MTMTWHSYVDRWFLRGKAVSRRPFKMFFGTIETEAKQEFLEAKLRGSKSLQETIAEDDALKREEAKKNVKVLALK
jgi:hypothetical protein